MGPEQVDRFGYVICQRCVAGNTGDCVADPVVVPAKADHGTECPGSNSACARPKMIDDTDELPIDVLVDHGIVAVFCGAAASRRAAIPASRIGSGCP